MNNDQMMKDILLSAKTVASVGLSSNRMKESYGIVEYLKGQGYHIVPVNPTAAEILGEKAYPDLESVPEEIDVVQVFRRPEDVPPVVDSAIKVSAKVVWMQLDVVNEEAAKKAVDAGLMVVMDKCIKLEHNWFVTHQML